MLKAFVIGHLGQDANTQILNGHTVINFSVAHSERFKNQSGEQIERTIWVSCSWWTDRTTIVPYLIKGTQVFVEGQPDVRSFQKRDGTNGVTLTLRVEKVQLLGSKKDNEPNSYNAGTGISSQPNNNAQEPIKGIYEDDVPF